MHKAFFGDRERDFSLTPHLIRELEKQTGKGIRALIEGARRASYADIVETIRLGLIGAGESPQEAHRLVGIYVPIRPLGEAHILALDILTDLWAGPEEQPTNDAAATGDMSAAINADAA